MKFPTLPKVLWSARVHANSVGAGALAAGLVFAGAALAVLFVLRPARSELEAIQGELASMRLHRQVQLKPGNVVAGPADQLAEFYRAFPARAAEPDAMAKLYAAAEQNHIDLEHGEYRWVSGKNDYLARYEIVLPVRGGYTAIRKFVVQALIDVPTMALDGMTFSRQKIEEPVVDAELRLTLFMGKK